MCESVYDLDCMFHDPRPGERNVMKKRQVRGQLEGSFEAVEGLIL